MPSRTEDAEANLPPLGSREIRLLSPDYLRLGFSEQSTIKIQLVDQDGSALPGQIVRFALVGRSQDAGLAQADVMTDADGIAENALTGSAMSASFNVRISSPGAYEKLVSAAISNAGFGTLRVQAPYVGARTMVQRKVFAQANMDCKDAMPMSGDPMATIGPKESGAEFLVLPADVSYAVLAVAEGKDGVVVARGCVDDVHVSAGFVTLIWVKFANEPLEVEGTFTINAELNIAAPADELGHTLRSAARTLVLTDGFGSLVSRPEARLLLDSLVTTLRSDSEDPASAELASAISTDVTAALELTTFLRTHDVGALSAVQLMTKLTTEDMQRLRLQARVGITNESDDELAITFDALRAEVLPKDATVPARAMVDLSQLPAAKTTATRGADDALEFGDARFAVPFGVLSSQVLKQVVSLGPSGHGLDLRTEIGCDALRDWLDWRLYTACGDGCVQMACDRALARLTSAAETALMAVDESRPMLTLGGELQLRDADGDLHAEELSSTMLTGEWNPAEGEVTGAVVEGEATPVPPVPNE